MNDYDCLACDHTRPGYWEECHWECCGHCNGSQHHDHRPWYMKLYWRSPLGLIVPPIWYFGARMGWWN